MKSPLFLIVLSLTFLGSSCQRRFERKVESELSKYRRIGLENHELEKTTKPIIRAYFSNKPPYPHYSNVMALRDHFREYDKDAKEFSSNDKVRHCYIGHIVARKHGYKTSVFIGFFKEAQDVGDKNRRTRFEITDKEATIYGAKLAMEKEEIETCHEAEGMF
ncbi:MAG: hypothetical protein K9K67_13365 [Bacteriovoracaceae bacterium]|nr:hypothetical protein [Bacteriovoracaceae bacterium]